LCEIEIPNVEVEKRKDMQMISESIGMFARYQPPNTIYLLPAINDGCFPIVVEAINHEFLHHILFHFVGKDAYRAPDILYGLLELDWKLYFRVERKEKRADSKAGKTTLASHGAEDKSAEIVMENSCRNFGAGFEPAEYSGYKKKYIYQILKSENLAKEADSKAFSAKETKIEG